MTVLTVAVRDRAVAALQHAATTGRPHATDWPAVIDADGVLRVCSCYVIAEALGTHLPAPVRAEDRDAGFVTDDMMLMYRELRRVGIDTGTIFHHNDRERRFVPEVVAGFDVVAEAEAICANELVPA